MRRKTTTTTRTLRHGPESFPRRQRGGALVEYTIVALLLVLVLITETDVIHQLTDALRKAYTSFVYALSISWI